jgi:hypothetical protein
MYCRTYIPENLHPELSVASGNGQEQPHNSAPDLIRTKTGPATSLLLTLNQPQIKEALWTVQLRYDLIAHAPVQAVQLYIELHNPSNTINSTLPADFLKEILPMKVINGQGIISTSSLVSSPNAPCTHDNKCSCKGSRHSLVTIHTPASTKSRSKMKSCSKCRASAAPCN